MIAIGCPVCMVRKVFNDQPPTIASARLFMPRPIQRPRPTGRSMIKAVVSRCVASFELIPCSAFRLSSSWGLSNSRFVSHAFRPAEESSVDFENV